ncbi:MAG: DUF4271 domain-containing protein [Prevotella sp.]|nr:DUF4271 domain-containing protein [Bacteroides sp.]MCM1365711.1 DUF4271 domain-containing protein [Prevotella sp.]MCM1436381.1 DUF4271 domain-containing protein [Prevotella sp.]
MTESISNATDSLICDTISSDSTVMEATPPGLVLVNPRPLHEGHRHVSPAAGNSWLLLALIILFAAVCFKFRSNTKYFHNLLRELTDVRERGNVFDDTVRETSFVWLLNIMCAISGGILLLYALGPSIAAEMSIMTAIYCLISTVGYCVLMPLLYWCVGDVFSDRTHARMWVRGFVSSQSILGLGLFPLSLLTIFYPESRGVILTLAGLLIITAKILFIVKGFRIFFTKYSSWVIFLYYLCSLEIVPLVLTFASAHEMIGN